jgi:hypothetical protein
MKFAFFDKLIFMKLPIWILTLEKILGIPNGRAAEKETELTRCC